jgi:RimJ/RimL family protein N-acetyltransferase
LPDRIVTKRLVLRAWRADDAPVLKLAIDSSLSDLQQWMPWAMTEPSSVAVIAERIDGFASAFANGTEWLFGIFTPDEQLALGGCGLHPRIGPAGLELGYWLGSADSGRGYATEAAEALTRAAFDLPSIDIVEIRCDPRNARSAAVAARLGYELVETLRGNALTPAGEPRDTMVWRFRRGMPIRRGA